MIFKSDAFYRVLATIGRLILPGIATLYSALAAIWGFPFAEQIAASIAAVCVFLNAILEWSNYKYHSMIGGE